MTQEIQHGPESAASRGCAGDCHQCGRMVDVPDAPLRGGQLATASLVTFLLPWVTALAGGLWWRTSPGESLVGVLIGLGLGVVAACLFFRAVYRNREISHNGAIVLLDQPDVPVDRNVHE